MRDKLKQNQGVTLVALVITIIVLVMLATVSITMVLGNQGIFTQAEEAKKLTTNAQIAEEEGFNQIYEQLTGYIKGEIIVPVESTPYMPEGSTVIENSTLENGLTIKDKNNNEWVWVIVPKSITAEATTEDEIYTKLSTYAAEYRKDYTDTWYEGCGLTEIQYNVNKAKMLNSIKIYGGFWIGRYELGTETQRKEKTDKLTTPLVQADKYPYNFITCSQSQERISLLTQEASITSSLLYGIQWDLTLKFIEEKGSELGEDKVDRQAKIKIDSSSWGNYKNSTFDIKKGEYSIDNGQVFKTVSGNYTKLSDVEVLLTTGVTIRNKVLNIDELAGNESEWTLEKSTNSEYPVTYRGGCFYFIGSNISADFRGKNPILDSGVGVTSRPTLYK